MALPGRKILNIAFGLIVGGFALYALFPRFQNDFSCESSAPANAAQSAGLADARARKAALCPGSRRGCKFVIGEDPDGSFRVSLYFVATDFFEGCTFKDQDSEVFVYGRDGKLVRIEGAPYG